MALCRWPCRDPHGTMAGTFPLLQPCLCCPALGQCLQMLSLHPCTQEQSTPQRPQAASPLFQAAPQHCAGGRNTHTAHCSSVAAASMQVELQAVPCWLGPVLHAEHGDVPRATGTPHGTVLSQVTPMLPLCWWDSRCVIFLKKEKKC